METYTQANQLMLLCTYHTLRRTLLVSIRQTFVGMLGDNYLLRLFLFFLRLYTHLFLVCTYSPITLPNMLFFTRTGEFFLPLCTKKVLPSIIGIICVYFGTTYIMLLIFIFTLAPVCLNRDDLSKIHCIVFRGFQEDLIYIMDEHVLSIFMKRKRLSS
jgi:hypothetical protein